jgi:hypothetical protein
MRPEKRKKTMSRERRLEDLVSVGPATKRDLALLGVHTVTALARYEPEDLYRRLCRKTGKRQDPCVLDVYCAAVEQARDPLLPPEQCVWWYWSRRRKESAEAGGRVTKSKANRREKQT